MSSRPSGPPSNDMWVSFWHAMVQRRTNFQQVVHERLVHFTPPRAHDFF
jgi:hypothetical protein